MLEINLKNNSLTNKKYRFISCINFIMSIDFRILLLVVIYHFVEIQIPIFNCIIPFHNYFQFKILIHFLSQK